MRKIVYICSRYSGDVERNTRNTQRYCRFASEKGCVPVAPHLMYPQFLDDENHIERRIGMSMGKVLLKHCDEMWVFGKNWSNGMIEEVETAVTNGIKIRYFSIKGEGYNG